MSQKLANFTAGMVLDKYVFAFQHLDTVRSIFRALVLSIAPPKPSGFETVTDMSGSLHPMKLRTSVVLHVESIRRKLQQREF